MGNTTINTNVLALNSHRSLKNVGNAQATASERLSSGLRINKAADDAAGLAISEKMRSQIRGLDMASRNSQDGISLIQTAEGALQETHNILQRMRELTVQAANDTVTEGDRQKIGLELTELTEEIDSISTKTQFNTKQLIDGSWDKSQIYLQTGANASQKMTFNIDKMDSAALGVGKNTVANVVNGSTSTMLGGASATKNASSSGTVLSSSARSSGATGDFTIDIATNGSETVSVNGKDIFTTDDDGNVTFNVAVEFANVSAGVTGSTANKVKISAGSTFTVAELNAKLKDVTDNGAAVALIDGGDGKTPNEVALQYDGAGKLTLGTNGPLLSASVTTKVSSNLSSAGSANTASGTSIEITLTGSETPQQYKLGNSDNTLTVNADGSVTFAEDTTFNLDVGAATGSVTVTLSGGTTYTADQLKSMFSRPTSSGATAYTSGGVTNIGGVGVGFNAGTGKIALGTYSPDFGTSAGTLSALNTSGGLTAFTTGGKTVIDLTDHSKSNSSGTTLTTGNIGFEVDRTGGTAQVTFTVGAGDILDINGVGTGIDDATLATLKKDIEDGNAIDASRLAGVSITFGNGDVVTFNSSASDTIGATVSGAPANVTQSNPFAEAKVTFGAGSGGSSRGEEISKLTTTIDSAIEKVSNQRAKLGAYQNRLEHTIKNLDVSSENLSAAESRIRDTDMAKEMMNLTKNNVLQQAATSMLAQANQAPQNVLSLLR